MRKPDFTNVLAVVVALWIGATCAGCGPVSVQGDTYHVVIDSDNWYAKTVRVYCDRHEVGAVRGVVMGQHTARTMRAAGCRIMQLRVDALGGDYWYSEQVLVMPGDTVKLRIGPRLELSSIMLRDP